MSEQLKAWLRHAELVLLIGVGNQTRGDDAAGTVVAELMEVHRSRKFEVMNVGEALGKLLPGAIYRRPSHILIVDATVMGQSPGSVRLIPVDEMDVAHFSSTHDLPVSVAIRLVTRETGAKALAIGIQPHVVSVGSRMSEPVRVSCEAVTEMLKDCLTAAELLGHE